MFSEKLKELRIKKGLTQGDLAKLTGLSPSAVGMYEQNRRTPDTAVLSKLSDVFGVSVDYLIREDAEINPQNIETAIDMFRKSLYSTEGLMFKGVPLSNDDIEKLSDAIKLSTRIVLEKESGI